MIKYEKPNPQDSPYLGGPGDMGGGKPQPGTGGPYTKPKPGIGAKPPMSTPPGGGMGKPTEPPWMAAARQQMRSRANGTWNPRGPAQVSMAGGRRPRAQLGGGGVAEMGMKPMEKPAQVMPMPMPGGDGGGGFDPMEYLRSYLNGGAYSPGGPSPMSPDKPLWMGNTPPPQGHIFPNQVPPGGFMEPPPGAFSTPYLGGPGGGLASINGGGLMAGPPPQQSMMNPAILARYGGRR